MNSIELHKFLEQWRKLGSLPSASGWPDKVMLSTGSWKKLSDIMGYTRGDGYEYAVNLFHVDNEILVTPYTRGTRENVTTHDSIQIRYEPRDKNYFEKKVFVNSKQVQSETIPAQKVPKKIEITYLFNVHTHPIQEDSYSFFSGTDIRSFLASDTLAMGLLTDRLWLVGKTNSSLKVLGENGDATLFDVSQKIFRGEKDIDKLIRENFKEWGIVFYKGELNQSLNKIDLR